MTSQDRGDEPEGQLHSQICGFVQNAFIFFCLGFPVKHEQPLVNIEEKILHSGEGVDRKCPPPSRRIIGIDSREIGVARRSVAKKRLPKPKWFEVDQKGI